MGQWRLGRACNSPMAAAASQFLESRGGPAEPNDVHYAKAKVPVKTEHSREFGAIENRMAEGDTYLAGCVPLGAKDSHWDDGAGFATEARAK